MATDLHGELEAFRRFVFEQFGGGQCDVPLEEAFAQFRAYTRDLVQFKRDTEQSMRESERGESYPIEIDDVIQRGRQRLSEICFPPHKRRDRSLANYRRKA